MSRLRLDLIVRRYWAANKDLDLCRADRWSWRLWAGSRIVSISGSQLYSRRIDCARGAEVGTGVGHVLEAVKDGGFAMRGLDRIPVRILDEREARP